MKPFQNGEALSLARIKLLFDELEKEMNNFSNGRLDEFLEFHTEGHSLNHCVRWGQQAADDLLEEIGKEGISTAPIYRRKTPGGIIDVYPSSDPNYPGVFIDINDQSAALVEYDPQGAGHYVRSWKRDEEDVVYSHSWGDDIK